jgi:DNA methylase
MTEVREGSEGEGREAPPCAPGAGAYWASEDGDVRLLKGDCRDVLPDLPECSVDAVVCDPPYDLTDGKKGGSGGASLNERHPAGRSRITTGGGFMGQTWDATGVAFDPATWRAVMRVMKPGAYLLAFGGSRTWHRMVCAIEDAGFEIRDPIADLTGMDAPGLLWIQGQGYPKNLDVSKAVDKTRNDRADILCVTSWLADAAEARGISRAQVDAHMGTSDMGGWWLSRLEHRCAVPTWEQWQQLRRLVGFGDEMDAEVWRLNGRKGQPGEAWQTAEVIRTEDRFNEPSGIVNAGQGPRSAVTRQIKAANSADAARWQGWGTALKPAWEPVCVARKPLAGTVAQNVLQYGTGALNLAACKVDHASEEDEAEYRRNASGDRGHDDNRTRDMDFGMTAGHASDDGRWPPNLVLGEAAAAEMDRQSGALTSGTGAVKRASAKGGARSASIGAESRPEGTPMICYGDSGGASRYFPVFKYTAKAPTHERPRLPDGTAWPTVKPLDFIRWLVRLVTPPGGTVGDFFLGSGPTAEACVIEGFRFIGIDKEEPALRLTVERLSKPIQPVMLTVDDSAHPARPHPLAASSRPKPPPEAHPSLFEEMDAAS